MTSINGNQNVDDLIIGTRASELILAESGDDVIFAARGDDTIVGGSGSDVMWGGLDSDTFQWSAGHLQDEAIDYIGDFSLGSDTLQFLASGGGQVVDVLSIVLTKLLETEFNGSDLRNNVDFGTDIVFTVMNSVTGNTQDIVLLDAWSASLNDAWVDYLATLGLEFT